MQFDDGGGSSANSSSAGYVNQRRRRSGSLDGFRSKQTAPPPPPGGLPVSGSMTHVLMAPVFERFHSFKEFMALQKDNLEPERAVDLYDHYKYDFKAHAARLVFQQSQTMGFVRERFSPERLAMLARAKIADGQVEARDLIDSYRAGKLSDLCLEFRIKKPETAGLLLKPEPHLNGRVVAVVENSLRFKGDDNSTSMDDSNNNHSSDTTTPTYLNMSDSPLFGPYHARNLNERNNVLVLKKLPGDVTSMDILDICQDIVGLDRVTLLPSCLLEENQGPLMLQASKSPTDCTEAELQTIEQIMSECYIRGRGSNSPLVPLQTAWLEFENEDFCSQAELALEKRPIKDLCTCTPMRIQAQGRHTKRLRISSSESESKFLEDVEYTKRLILKLDREFEIFSSSAATPWPPRTAAPTALSSDNADEIASLNDLLTSDMHDDTNSALVKKDDEKEDDDTNKEEEGDPELKTYDHSNIKEAEVDKPTTTSSVPSTAETAITDASHPFLSLIEKELPKKRLDLQLLYLRRVHAMDYYSGKICWSARELFEICGMATVRLILGTEDVVVLEDSVSQYMVQESEDALFHRQIRHILSQNYTYWMNPIEDEHPLFLELWGNFCQEKTLQVDPDKFRCGICRKLFKGAEFVWKHLRNKHFSEADPVKHAVRGHMMKQAFENDEFRLLLFVVQTNDFLRVFHKPNQYNRHSADGSGYGPTRRGRFNPRSGPIGSLPDSKQYRDWDAPRSRLEEKAAGGNFRRMIRYDDL